MIAKIEDRLHCQPFLYCYGDAFSFLWIAHNARIQLR
jgi:hypothetical protein